MQIFAAVPKLPANNEEKYQRKKNLFSAPERNKKLFKVNFMR